MATGIYGTVRPADMSPEDVDINVFYAPNRGSQNSRTFKLDSGNLIPINNPNNTSSNFEIFGGLYTLRLPVSDFSNKGIYTIVFKSVEIRTKIIDCGVLSSFPDIKGVVFDITKPGVAPFINKFQNNQLIGYRIEYLANEGSSEDRKIKNTFRIITSNNKAEPVNQNLSDTSQKAIRYRFDDNSNLVFCTVSPSSPTNVKPNILPFIGTPNQDVIITNTYFTPFALEIEMVEYDIETLAVGLFGNQTKSLEDGIYTIYNFQNEIYKQFNLFEIKDRFDGKPLFEVKENRFNNIDFTKGFDDIANV
tara:strand:- start:7659 stop:8573 length:915 start_codon:yes stop_codon:yes gene_type:complete